MKRTLTLAALGFCLSIAACKKDDAANGDKRTSTKPTARVLTDGDNAEFDRICGDATAWEYHVAINDNPNYGHFSAHPDEDVMMSGASPTGVQIWLDDSLYQPYSNGQWLRQGGQFKQWFGKTVQVRMKNGGDESSRSVYIPNQLLAQRANSSSSGPVNAFVSRTGNTFTWQPDAQSTTSRVAIHYMLEGRDENNQSTLISNDVVIVNDDGSFNADNLITPETITMRLWFVRGNSSSLETAGGKILFSICSYDIHSYTFID